MADEETVSNNNKKKPRSISLNHWHVYGLARRLNCEIHQIPRWLDKRTQRNQNKFLYDEQGKITKKPYQWPARRTIEGLGAEGCSFYPQTLKKIITIVNNEMIRNEVPQWIPKISMEWMEDPNPDLRWRQHIPNYVNWDDLITDKGQNEVEGQMCGLYYIYRPHGLAHTKHEGDGVQRELLCIHAPVEGHIRVHRVNKYNNISSGLGYREGNLFTIALYRSCLKHGMHSAFLMIHHPDGIGPQEQNETEIEAVKQPLTKPDVMRMVISRSSGHGGAYASGALLVRVNPDKISEKTQLAILKHLRSERRKGADDWNIDGKPAFKEFMPIRDLPWSAKELEAEKLQPHRKFLQDAVFRLDDYVKEDPKTKLEN